MKATLAKSERATVFPGCKAALTAALLIAIQSTLLAQDAPGQDAPPFREDRILVKPLGPGVADLHARFRTRVLRSYPEIGGLQVIELPPGLAVQQAVAAFKNSGLVEYAEPDYIVSIAQLAPNDPSYTDGTLWAMNNTGQNGGTADADIDGPEGWNRAHDAASVIVAVIDTGVRYTHQDLAANIWTNPGEIAGNGIDDDGNGYVDDVHGINAITGSGDPNDDNGHGTHVSGTIGAVGNNGIGVVGVAWRAQIMGCKFLDFTGNGSTSDAIEAINYAIRQRAHILNNSWGGGPYSDGLREAIAAARNRGMLFVAAAGNDTPPIDNDTTAFYPASYDIDNIVAVAATTRNDGLASYSHWGRVRVHLAAPGGDQPPLLQPLTNGIYSTWYTSDSAYGWIYGTSMATPHVSGALAVMRNFFPFESYLQLRNRLLSNTDPLAALTTRCQTGGRLNLDRALASTSSRPPNDNFANAFTIVKPAGTAITFVANNVDATRETGEPNHAGVTGPRSVWWNWTAPDGSSITLRTAGSGFDTVLAVYTGNSVSSLTAVASNNDALDGGASQVTFIPTAGTTYRIAVDGVNGASGTIKLTIDSAALADQADLRFDVSTVQRPSGQFSVRLLGRASTAASIERSLDLTTWGTYANVNLNAAGTFDYTDTQANSSAAFYRARITAAPPQFSCNVVGYVDVSARVGDSMIANSFNRLGNGLAAVLPNVPAGTQVYKWNGSSWIVYQYDFGAWSPAGGVLAPGEGAVFRNSTQSPLALTFVGEVPQSYTINPVPNGMTIRSSIVAEPGRVATDLLLPVMNGDSIQRLVNGSYVTYTFNNGIWSPSQPIVSRGESFWAIKNVGFNWTRNWLVWP